MDDILKDSIGNRINDNSFCFFCKMIYMCKLHNDKYDGFRKLLGIFEILYETDNNYWNDILLVVCMFGDAEYINIIHNEYKRDIFEIVYNPNDLMTNAIISDEITIATLLLEKYTIPDQLDIHRIISDKRIVNYLFEKKYYDMLIFLIGKDKQFIDIGILDDIIAAPVKRMQIHKLISMNLQSINANNDIREHREYLLKYHESQLLNILVGSCQYHHCICKKCI